MFCIEFEVLRTGISLPKSWSVLRRRGYSKSTPMLCLAVESGYETFRDSNRMVALRCSR